MVCTHTASQHAARLLGGSSLAGLLHVWRLALKLLEEAVWHGLRKAVAQHWISAGAAKCSAWRLLFLGRSCAAHAQSRSCGLQVFDMIEFSLVKRGWKNDGIVRFLYR